MSNVLRLAYDRDTLTEAEASEKLEVVAEVLTAQQEGLHAAVTLMQRWLYMLPTHAAQVAAEMNTCLSQLSMEGSEARH